LYDAVLKRTLVGPAFMGLCRFFNVLLGMSLAAAVVVGPAQLAETRPWTMYFTDGQLLVAAALGVYVLGITLFARKEAQAGLQPQMVQGLAVMVLGIATLLFVPRPDMIPPAPNFAIQGTWVWPALLVMLVISVGRHCLTAIADPEPRRIQLAVKFALLCIITFDAAVALWSAGPYVGLAVFALIAPMLILGRIVYST
jgi:4-hydroxybenzoate polyprenyltransferase